MYNKNDILLKLNSENYYIDRRTLSAFITSWNIEAVYENEDEEEYYDDYAIEKIKKGINLKAQGFSDAQIIRKLKNIENINTYTTVISEQESVSANLPADISNCDAANIHQNKSELRNLTLDVTTQTLQMLAESVAKKITEDIKNSDMAEKLIEAGGYKKDNEILSQQVQELIEHNKKLSERIEQLEKHEGFFDKLVKLFK